MQRILFVLFSCTLFGAILAQRGLPLPVRPGVLGALVMLSAAWYLRERWRLAADAPEAPERSALLSLGGSVVVLSHLLSSLWQIGPAMDLHSNAAHAMGVDTWTLVVASLVMGRMARAPGPSADERDKHIAASAMSVAHYTLLLQMLALVLWLAFGRGALLEHMSRVMLAQLLVCFWMVSSVVHDIVCLRAYARDRRWAGEAE